MELKNEGLLNKCIDWSLKNKFWVIILSLLFLLFTAYKVNELTVDAVPDITNVQVVINTKTRGLDPEKVELTVSQPIEYEMMGIPHLHDLRSISKFGLSQVILIFDDGTDIYWARQQVMEKLQSAVGQIPVGLMPELAPISTGLGEVYMYGLSLKDEAFKKYPTHLEKMLYLREVQDFIIRPELRRVKDVADVDSNGGYKKQLHINLNPYLLKKFGITIDVVERKLKGLGESFGGGSIVVSKEALIIRTSTAIDDIKEFESIPVAVKFNGEIITLKDISHISMDAAPRLGSATMMGEETVLGTVLMKSGGNGRVVSSEVDDYINKIKLPDDVKVTRLYSRAFLVNTTLKTVIKNLIEGALLVIFILLILLGHFRAAIIVSLVIPLSMLGTTMGMQFFHISGNLMSLGAIDFGLVVDGAVVLVETLLASFAVLTVNERASMTKDQIISLKAKEVMRPVVFGLLMIMFVYLPILLLEGIEGKMFKPMAYTVLMTLGWSLVLTVFLIPVLVSLFIKIPEHSSDEDHDTYLFKKVKTFYKPILFKTVDQFKMLTISAVLIGIISMLLFTQLGADFVPQLDEGDIVINITRNSRISLDEALEQQYKVDQILKSFSEVDIVFSRLGTPESATDPMGVHLTDIFVILKKDRELWKYKTKDQLFEAMRKKIEEMKLEQEVSSNQPIEMRFNEMLEGSRADVSLRVVGNDLNYLMATLEDLTTKVEKVEGLEGVEMDPLTALRKSQVIDIKPKLAELAKLNLSLDEFNQTIVSFMQGSQIGDWIKGTRKYPIMVHLSEELRDKLDEMKKLPISLPEGGFIPLEQVATITIKDQVTTISRNWGKRYAALSVNIANRDTMSFVNDLKAITNNYELKPNHQIVLGGQFNNLERAKKRLLVIIPLTLFLILFILWREFSSFKDALMIFLCVPFATFGGVIALWLRGIHLSLSAAVGFIALIGIALLNGIVLLTVFNQLKETKMSIRDLVLKGTLSRLRPVLMTAMVASIGFIPMAINTGLGAEVQRPLATVVIGGILFSTLLTLILFPAVYLRLHQEKSAV